MTKDLYPDFSLEEIVRDLGEKSKALIKTQTYPKEGIRIEKDLAYGQNPGQVFDIYYKEGLKNPKTLIGIHGGGLVFGSKEVNQAFNLRLVDRGYNMASISYRPIPKVSFMDQVKDLESALNHIKEKSYSLGTRDFYLVADSAGAMLCLVVLAALKNEKIKRLFGLNLEDIKVKGLALLYPMTGLVKTGSFSLINGPVLKSIKEPKIRSLMDDMTKILEDIDLPPVFILTSKEDFIRNQALSLRSYLEKEGQTYDFLDQKSTRPLAHGHVINQPETKEACEVIENMVRFFAKI